MIQGRFDGETLSKEGVSRVSTEEIGKYFNEIANCPGLKDLTTDEIKWVIKLMQCVRNDALKETECKHSMLRHNKCVACGETVGPYIQFQLHHY